MKTAYHFYMHNSGGTFEREYAKVNSRRFVLMKNPQKDLKMHIVNIDFAENVW